MERYGSVETGARLTAGPILIEFIKWLINIVPIQAVPENIEQAI